MPLVSMSVTAAKKNINHEKNSPDIRRFIHQKFISSTYVTSQLLETQFLEGKLLSGALPHPLAISIFCHEVKKNVLNRILENYVMPY